MNNKSISSLAISNSNIFAGTVGDGVYLSTNDGSTWTQTSLNNLTVYSLIINGNYLFAGTENGIFLTTNNGLNWIQ
ncbi:WD40/YVTN/BNR-like repeat-containing protein, partial [Vibrio parahaemolyticus]|uniref:WD40/YVTN/BNR-like repeat-containing protein n=1 Tax=Vibrio parahaemolyticus TaxID=670 RepID=UPI001C5E0E1F